jgi:hypothetical protein
LSDLLVRLLVLGCPAYQLGNLPFDLFGSSVVFVLNGYLLKLLKPHNLLTDRSDPLLVSPQQITGRFVRNLELTHDYFKSLNDLRIKYNLFFRCLLFSMASIDDLFNWTGLSQSAKVDWLTVVASQQALCLGDFWRLVQYFSNSSDAYQPYLAEYILFVLVRVVAYQLDAIGTSIEVDGLKLSHL